MRKRLIEVSIWACAFVLYGCSSGAATEAEAEPRQVKFRWGTDFPTIGIVHSSEIITPVERQCIRRVKWVEWSSGEANNPRRYSADLHIAELADRAKVEQGIRACLAGGRAK